MKQPKGFAKKGDPACFLKTICQGDYRNEPRLAPTREMLDQCKKTEISWDEYKELLVTFSCTDDTDDTVVY